MLNQNVSQLTDFPQQWHFNLSDVELHSNK